MMARRRKINPVLLPRKLCSKNYKKQRSYAAMVDQLSELGFIFSIVGFTRVGVGEHKNKKEFASVGGETVDIFNEHGFFYVGDAYKSKIKYAEYLYTDEKSYIAVHVYKECFKTCITLNYCPN